MDGDLGSYDDALEIRLRTADTVIVLDLAFPRCAWRTKRPGWERADYWRWVWAYRRQILPGAMQAVTAAAPRAKVYVLRNPGMIRRFTARLRQAVGGHLSVGGG